MSTKGGPVFTFSFLGRERPPFPLLVMPLSIRLWYKQAGP